MATTSTNIISIKECLEHMESGKAFSCRVVAYDRRRKTGGQLLDYEEAILVQNTSPSEFKGEDEDGDPARPMTRMEELHAMMQMSDDDNRRNPNHRHHYTRNIRILQDGHPTAIIKKIHPPLLLRFNGQTVVP